MSDAAQPPREDLDPTIIFDAFGTVVFPADPEAVADAIIARGGASVAKAIDFTVRVQRWASELRSALERKATVQQLGDAEAHDARPYGLWTPPRRDDPDA